MDGERSASIPPRLAIAGGLHRELHAPRSYELHVRPGGLYSRKLGLGGTTCTGIVTTGPAKVTPGASGTPCSTTKNQASRFLLTTPNPTQRRISTWWRRRRRLEHRYSDEGTAKLQRLGNVPSQHRLSSTFSLLFNWTWSKCLNEEDAQGDLANEVIENPNNPAKDYGPHAGPDFPAHRKHLDGSKKQGLVGQSVDKEAFVNGWELAPFMHIQTGSPFTVTQVRTISLTDVGNDRPNPAVAGVNPYAEGEIPKGHRRGKSLNTLILRPFSRSAPTT